MKHSTCWVSQRQPGLLVHVLMSVGASAVEDEVVVGKVQQLLSAPSKESRQLVPRPPTGFQKVLKDRVSEGGCGVQDQLVDAEAWLGEF